jgi:hypothetical protein
VGWGGKMKGEEERMCVRDIGEGGMQCNREVRRGKRDNGWLKGGLEGREGEKREDVDESGWKWVRGEKKMNTEFPNIVL